MNSKGRTNTYEAMFLFPQGAGSDLHNVLMTLNTIFERSSCELIALRKWDERKLAFEINKNKRGIYFLAYFDCDPANMIGFERDCNLSEDIIRFMVTRADHLSGEEMRAQDQRGKLTEEGQVNAEDVPSVSASAEGEGSADAAEAPAEEPEAASSDA